MYGDKLYQQVNYTVQEQPEPIIEEAVVTNNLFGLTNEREDKIVQTGNYSEDWQSATTVAELNESINGCQKCPLGKTRNKFVFGTGNPDADVMLVGEGPGADEDAQGEPFVGRAGKLLTDILAAINFKREDVFIANIVKCRPPGNRNPNPDEIKECIPFLKKQIELVKPKMILCLGLVAANSLLGKKLSLTKMRGNFFVMDGVKVLVTYHPAALLRNPNWKRGCWEDVQLFRKYYDENVVSNNG